MFRHLKILLLIAVLVLPASGAAQTVPRKTARNATLPEVVVTASRTEEETEKIPAHVTVITREDINQSNAKTIPDLLRSSAGVTVRNLLGNGKSAQVDLRGFGETGPYNTLVLVDGRRVNGIDLSGVDWTQIPIDRIERIEIVRGTGSVLYGDNAVGGVINIITKIPSDGLTADAGLTLGSYEHRRLEASVNGREDKTALSLFASSDRSDGYRVNNRYDAIDFGGKITYDATDVLSLHLNATHHADDYGLPGPLTEAELAADRRSSTNPDDKGKSQDSYLKAGLEWAVGETGSFMADVFLRDRKSEAVFPDTTSPLATKTGFVTWGLTPRFVWDGALLGRDNKLIVGIDVYASRQDTDSFGGFFIPLSTQTAVSDITRDSIGMYVNDSFSLSEHLVVSLGARYESVRYDLSQEDLTGLLGPLQSESTQTEPAFNVGLTYLYTQKSSVFARFNRSFRFPLTDEIVYIDWSTFTIKANADLKPQTGIHYETGIRHYFSPETLITLTLFRAEMDNEIFYNPATFGNENHPETLHQGLEIGFNAAVLDHLSLFGNFTYEDATFEKAPYRGNDIPAVPNAKGNLGVKLNDLFTSGLAFMADYTYTGASYAVSDQANDFDKLKAYYTIDVRLSYQWKSIKGFIGINNVTDQKYSEYAVMDTFLTRRNFYPAPERNWVAGFQWVY